MKMAPMKNMMNDINYRKQLQGELARLLLLPPSWPTSCQGELARLLLLPTVLPLMLPSNV